MQEFTAPLNTAYKIECWGASGGDGSDITEPGMGGYTSGNINIPQNIGLYLYIGESPILRPATFCFNGGGGGEAPGGGATDIRLVGGEWNNFESLKSRIMVAGGGGGGFYTHNTSNREPGHAGGLTGISANCTYRDVRSYPNKPLSGYSGEGGLQTRGGKYGTGAEFEHIFDYANGGFGYGGYAYLLYNSTTKIGKSSGGGSGYYGGGHGVHPGSGWTGGGGGSSFISGYPGCDAIAESSTENNIVHTGQPNHYSGKVFTNSVMIAGNASMPSPSGGTETGHEGNGYATITWQQLPQ